MELLLFLSEQKRARPLLVGWLLKDMLEKSSLVVLKMFAQPSLGFCFAPRRIKMRREPRFKKVVRNKGFTQEINKI